MDYPSLRRLYSIARILSTAKKGESLTDIQHTTRLSFQTVLKTVNHLESLGLLSTRLVSRERGRTREIVYVSEDYKEVSIFFDRILQKYNGAVNKCEKDKCSSLLFEKQILEKTKEEMEDCLEYSFSPELGKAFDRWLENGDPLNLSKESFPIDEKARMKGLDEIMSAAQKFMIEAFSFRISLNLEEPDILRKTETEVTG